jgi:inner membrane transporter RhtA
MICAFVFVSPIGLGNAAHSLTDPVALAAGIGVGVSSSVVPYVFDQLAMSRLPRATYALFVSLLPATASVIGVVVLHQLPTRADVAGIVLVMTAVALHRPAPGSGDAPRRPAPPRRARGARSSSGPCGAASAASVGRHPVRTDPLPDAGPGRC